MNTSVQASISKALKAVEAARQEAQRSAESEPVNFEVFDALADAINELRRAANHA